MELINGFSSTILLDKIITKSERQKCYDVLVTSNFSGYDYALGINISFEEMLKKYPNRPRYISTYKNENFGISCAEGNDFITCRIDNDSEDSKIITTIIDEFCKIIEEISFSYIDEEGDSPNKFEKTIKNKEIKWLFKYNYFGKDFIEKYGRDFFLQMPCEKAEFITEDIIRIDLCKDIFTTIDKKLMEDIDIYLNKFSIKVHFYNSTNFFK